MQRSVPPSPASRTRPPLLLVLDLNGTLLCRKKNKKGRSVPGGRITPRPYLQTFLRYCLGPLYDTRPRAAEDPFSSGRAVLAAHQPAGAQYWRRHGKSVCAPPPTPVHVMVWSSATRENVNRMVEQILPAARQRALLHRVWARETLVTPRDLQRRVETTKDLSIVWDELNRWEQYLATRAAPDARLPFRARALAHDRLQAYVKAAPPMEAAPPAAEDGTASAPLKSRESQALYAEARARTSAKLDDVYGAMLTYPYGPHNTLLLDDSASKARCQPHHHICVADYDAERARAYQHYMDHPDDADAADLDDVLLQCVGLLEELTDVDDIPAWIAAGHAAALAASGPSEARTRWLARAREALARMSIAIEP